VSEPPGLRTRARQGGRVKRIVEDRRRDRRREEDRRDQHVGCTASPPERLWSALGKVRSDNDQGEYYLTDVIGVLSRAGARVDAIVASDPSEAVGVNDRKQLAAVTAIQRHRILDRLMEGGVTILDRPAPTSRTR